MKEDEEAMRRLDELRTRGPFWGSASCSRSSGINGLSLGARAHAADEGDGQFLEASFQRDPSRNDVTINVQAADSPAGPWTTVATSIDGKPMIGPGLISESALTDGLILVHVRDTVPIFASKKPRRFLRVVV